jgi:CHASE3 domain sensor protein
MKSLDRGLLSVMGLVVVLLLLNTWFAYRYIRQMRDDAQTVDHTHHVLAALEAIISSVKDAETGQRGYLITGE